MNFFQFLSLCIRRAIVDSIRVLELGSASKIFLTTATWISTSIFIFFYDKKMFGDEIPWYFAAGFSFMATAFLVFAYSLSLSSTRLYSESEENRKSYRRLVSLLKDKDDLLRSLISIHDNLLEEYDKGYGTEEEMIAWEKRMNELLREAIGFVQQSFNQSFAFSIKNNDCESYKRFSWEDSSSLGNSWIENLPRTQVWGQIRAIRYLIEDQESYWRTDLDEVTERLP